MSALRLVAVLLCGSFLLWSDVVSAGSLTKARGWSMYRDIDIDHPGNKASPVSFSHNALLDDPFTGAAIDGDLWHIPTWTSSTDGTFIGRTQFRVTQNSPPPTVSNGNVHIPILTYNPTGFSFYGTELISNEAFEPASGHGIDVKVTARLSKTPPGLVGGIFLYALKEDGNHDEIDFELVTNRPD